MIPGTHHLGQRRRDEDEEGSGLSLADLIPGGRADEPTTSLEIGPIEVGPSDEARAGMVMAEPTPDADMTFTLAEADANQASAYSPPPNPYESPTARHAPNASAEDLAHLEAIHAERVARQAQAPSSQVPAANTQSSTNTPSSPAATETPTGEGEASPDAIPDGVRDPWQNPVERVPANPRTPREGARDRVQEGEQIRDLLNRLEAARSRSDDAQGETDQERRRRIGLGIGSLAAIALGRPVIAAGLTGALQGNQQAGEQRRAGEEQRYRRTLDAYDREAGQLQERQRAERQAEVDELRRLVATRQLEQGDRRLGIQEQRQAVEAETMAQRLENQGMFAEAALIRARAYDASRRRRGGGGGGSGSGAEIPRPEGVDETTWNALPRREQIRLARESASAGARQARQGGDGIEGKLLYERGGIQIRSNLPEVDSVIARAATDAIGGAQGAMTALAIMERVSDQTGLAELVPGTPAYDRATGELEAAKRMLLAAVAQVQQTGIINPSEMPAILASLPDPTSLRQWATGSFQNRLGSWRGQFEGQLRTALVSASVEDAQINALVRQLSGQAQREGGGRSGARQPSTPAQGTGRRRYRVNGREAELSPADVQWLEREGAEVTPL